MCGRRRAVQEEQGAGPVYRTEGAGCCTAPCTRLLLPHPGYTAPAYTALCAVYMSATVLTTGAVRGAGALGSVLATQPGQGSLGCPARTLCLVSAGPGSSASRMLLGI